MGGCAAINCTNHSRKGIRMFSFPTEKERRKKWVINCRRDKWEPGRSAQLCIVHFEDSQFEHNRQDNWIRLKLDAVPTIFDVPLSNKPETFASKRVKGLGIPKPGTVLHSHIAVSNPNDGDACTSAIVPEKENVSVITPSDNIEIDVQNSDKGEDNNELLLQKIALLEKENEKLKLRIEENSRKFSSFLSEEQMKNAGKSRTEIVGWSHESIIKGLKMRFALGKIGFNYLRSTGYPIPSYSTLNRKIQGLSFQFGVLMPLFNILDSKVSAMDDLDKQCCIMIDEVEITPSNDFDSVNKNFVGNVTLGSSEVPGNHYTAVLLRGLKTPWKQVVAHEITGASTSGPAMKSCILSVIQAAKAVGLQVRALTSDMGSNNKAMWNSLGVSVTRKERVTKFNVEDVGDVHIIADVPHILKNLRMAFLTGSIILPADICERENLPTNVISSHYIKELWNEELKRNGSLRSLHHLKRHHIFPTHFSKMNVATAVQLFSVKTAGALESAVHLKRIEKEALTCAWWIRLINEWFEVMTARHCTKSITVKNSGRKIEFLMGVVEIFQNLRLGTGWKPVQTGVIMSTLSVVNLTQELFEEDYSFFMPGRLSQDALENVFSQVRRKAGSKPTALQARQAVKLICVSQFISDIRNTNYSTDSDRYLLDFSKVEKGKVSHGGQEDVPSTCADSGRLLKNKTADDDENIYFMAGAAVNTILKRKICGVCSEAVKNVTDPDAPVVNEKVKHLTEYCDMGGLKKPSSGIYSICKESEVVFQTFKGSLLAQKLSVDANFIDIIKRRCTRINLPDCCSTKDLLIKHYLHVRCQGTTKHMSEKRTYATAFGSSSMNKKTKKIEKFTHVQRVSFFCHCIYLSVQCSH